MESPFKFFRKHQKQLLVFVFLAAMLAFTIGDPLMKLAGYVRGGTGGGQESLVETNVGNLSPQEMENLVARRSIANQFIQRAAQAAAVPEAANFNFGSASQGEVLFAWLMRKEADRLGIQIDTPNIDNFLVRQFRRKLSANKFKDVCEEMRQTPYGIYDILKDELLTREAQQVVRPNVAASPEQLWRYYQQVHTRQKVEAVAVPVSSFTDAIADPTDREIADLFEKHKTSFDVRDNPRISLGGEYKPGFRQPRKVQLQYLKLSFEDAEAAVAKGRPVTDEEIQKYYDDNKAVDLTLQEPPEPTSGAGGLSLPTDEEGESSTETPAEADEAAPTSPGTEDRPQEPATPNEAAPPETPTEEAPATPAAEPETPSPSEPAPETPSEPAPPSSSCQEEAAPPAAEPTPPETPTTEPSATEPPATEAQPTEPAPADETPVTETPPASETEPAAESDEAPQAVMEDEEAATPAAPPKKKETVVRYKPLDDELKEIIRDRIIRDRAKTYLRKKANEISDAMFREGQKLARFVDPEKLSKADAKERRRLEEEIQVKSIPDAAEALKKIGTDLGGVYGETELLSPTDLSEHPVLGKTQEVILDEKSTALPQGIVTVCFRGQGLYAALSVEDSVTSGLQDSRYVLWKVREVADHIPTLDEPGVREQVVKAWKRLKAIPKATERAQAIAELVRKGTSFTEAVADQTVTGAKEGGELKVVETPEFSWFRQSSAMSGFGREQLELGNPVVLDGVGEKFMEKIFDGLGENEVGVVPNDEASIIYVTKVKERRPASREAFKSAPLFGISFGRFSLPSQYQELAARESQRLLVGFDKELQKRYAVKYRNAETGKLVELTEDDAGDESDDE